MLLKLPFRQLFVLSYSLVLCFCKIIGYSCQLFVFQNLDYIQLLSSKFCTSFLKVPKKNTPIAGVINLPLMLMTILDPSALHIYTFLALTLSCLSVLCFCKIIEIWMHQSVHFLESRQYLAMSEFCTLPFWWELHWHVCFMYTYLS